jgi:hypothetical protein
MRFRAVIWCRLTLAVLACALQFSTVHAQTGGNAPAMQDYEETIRQADALVAAGDAFEAVRLYERASRVAYNNKLPIDKAALDAKLAAARSVRDASKSTAVAPAPAAATVSPAPRASAAPESAAGTTSAEDANAWIRYGDELAAVSEYGDAVRAYERGRRLAVSNRVPYDHAALDAKIAAAAKARDIPRVSTDLIPEPLPPLPYEPGAEPEIPYLRDRPGKLRPWSVNAQYSKAEMHATDAELRAFDANLRKVMAVLTQAPVLNPPVGFELDVSTTLGSFEDVKERERYVAAHLPLPGAIRFSGSPYMEVSRRSKSTGATSKVVGLTDEVFCRYEITVNRRPEFNDGSGNDRILDGDEAYFLEPKNAGEIGGLPVYNDMLVIARPGAVLWIPVSIERALTILMPQYKSAADFAAAGIEGHKRAYAEFMSPAAQEKRQREVATQRAAGAEANARKLEIMQRRWEEDARKESESAENNPKLRGSIDIYQNARTTLAALDAQGRAAPACIVPGVGPSPTSDWRVVPLGTPGCRPLVQGNPDLLSGRVPRSELQILYVDSVTAVNRWLEARKFERNQPGDCVAMAKILRETQWRQLVGLLVR